MNEDDMSDLLWELAELAHTCGYCCGGPHTDKCIVDGTDAAIARRIRTRLIAVFNEGYIQGAEDAAGGFVLSDSGGNPYV